MSNYKIDVQRSDWDTINKSKAHDYERNLPPNILKGYEMV